MRAIYRSIILAISLFFTISASISAAPGDLDPTFGNGGKLTDWAGPAGGVALQPDGKIVIVGRSAVLAFGFDLLASDFKVARYNPDGTPDTTFGGGTGRVTTDFGGNYDDSQTVVIQPDGKIIVAGLSTSTNSGGLALARYNQDGSLDTTFGGGSGKVLTPGPNPAQNWWHVVWWSADVAVQPDGKILGLFGDGDHDDDYAIHGLLVRYHSDGSPDASFGSGGSVLTDYILRSVTVQPSDGKIVALGSGRIARFNTNGSLDSGFGSGGTVTIPAVDSYSIAIDSVGKIVTAGESYDPIAQGAALFRCNENGSPDSSFDGDGIVTTPSIQFFHSVVIQSDGRLVAAGYSQGPGNSDLALARYNSNGSLDNTFGGGDGITTVDFNSIDFSAAVALDSQGRALVVGGTGQAGRAYVFAIARLLGDPTPTCSNAIDCADSFVRQHYRDFLNREPDPAGLTFWTNEITSCGSDPQCIEVKRINVSAAYFLSIEFQQSGYLVYRFYKAAFGNLPGAPVPLTRGDFLPDAQQLGQGVIVNQPGWETVLENNKQTFALQFVQRPRFISAYPTSLTPAQLVDALFANAGVVPSSSERSAAIEEFGAAGNTADVTARSRALRRVAENSTLAQQEFNRAFVLMQYFGYLRRNPNDAPDSNFDGYNFWLNKLNQFNGDFVQAEMVKAFLTSTEYRRRFAP